MRASYVSAIDRRSRTPSPNTASSGTWARAQTRSLPWPSSVPIPSRLTERGMFFQAVEQRRVVLAEVPVLPLEPEGGADDDGGERQRDRGGRDEAPLRGAVPDPLVPQPPADRARQRQRRRGVAEEPIRRPEQRQRHEEAPDRGGRRG